MRDEKRTKEIGEARRAGREALCSLQKADEKLAGARNWGVWDMLGGGLLSTIVKQSKISDASELMEDAKRKLGIFQRELRDVGGNVEIRMEIGEFLTFADFFFDGLIADCIVQSKIVDARRRVQEAIRRVEKLLHALEGMENVIDVEYREV